MTFIFEKKENKTKDKRLKEICLTEMEVIERHEKVLKKAKEIYGDLPFCGYKLSKRGGKTSMAHYAFKPGFHCITYQMEWIQKDLEYMINDTIPHEITHFVCNVKGLGKNHDEGWKKSL